MIVKMTTCSIARSGKTTGKSRLLRGLGICHLNSGSWSEGRRGSAGHLLLLLLWSVAWSLSRMDIVVEWWMYSANAFATLYSTRRCGWICRMCLPANRISIHQGHWGVMENVKDPIEAAVADKEKKGRLFLFYTFQIIVMECGTGAEIGHECSSVSV